MDESDAKNIVEAARELGEAYEETEGLLSGFTESLKAAENLYGSGKKGTGADLVSLGMRARTFTYPTYNIRQLSKDVANRLAGRNDKAVRQLELTYGGGKTHTLITLYHLFHSPEKLPDLPAVKEFIEDIGFQPSKARIVVLSFDKIDVEKGAETTSPTGARAV